MCINLHCVLIVLKHKERKGKSVAVHAPQVAVNSETPHKSTAAVQNVGEVEPSPPHRRSSRGSGNKAGPGGEGGGAEDSHRDRLAGGGGSGRAASTCQHLKTPSLTISIKPSVRSEQGSLQVAVYSPGLFTTTRR